MIYVLIAILCSVVVSINLKLLNRYYTSAYQTIVFNYPTAALLCLLLFKPDLTISLGNNKTSVYFLIAVLLISIFYFISKSIATSGIVLTAIAQRLSLIIPVVSAFLIFGESLNTLKVIGLIVGFLAIYTSKPQGKLESRKITVWFPLIVFLGTGILDVFFNMLTKFEGIPFTTSLFWIFCIATIIGLTSLAYLFITKKSKFQLKALFAGIVLGFFNFGSIYFYIKALAVENNRPSVVFSSLDIGVIALGSLVGLLLFKEKLTKLNKIGLILALIAIGILSFA